MLAINACNKCLHDYAEICLGKHKNKFYLEQTKQNKEQISSLSDKDSAELKKQIKSIEGSASDQVERILSEGNVSNRFACLMIFFEIYQDFCAKTQSLIANALMQNKYVKSPQNFESDLDFNSLSVSDSFHDMSSDSGLSSPPLLYSPKSSNPDSWEAVNERDKIRQSELKKQQRRNTAGSSGASVSSSPTFEMEGSNEHKNRNIVSAQELYNRASTNINATNFVYDLIMGRDVQIDIVDLHRIFNILKIDYTENKKDPGHFLYKLPDGSTSYASGRQESGTRHTSSASLRVPMHGNFRNLLKASIEAVGLTKETWNKFANPNNTLKPN